MITIKFQFEESKSKIESLQQQIACLEDGLCEARLEASRVRTELVSEKSTSEVRLAEMQSKLNEVNFLSKTIILYTSTTQKLLYPLYLKIFIITV